MQVVKQTVLSR